MFLHPTHHIYFTCILYMLFERKFFEDKQFMTKCNTFAVGEILSKINFRYSSSLQDCSKKLLNILQNLHTFVEH